MIKSISLRLPHALYTVLVAVAKAERRSLHAQIVLILEQFVRAHSDKQS
jgi:hypothetical protein